MTQAGKAGMRSIRTEMSGGSPLLKPPGVPAHAGSRRRCFASKKGPQSMTTSG
jgi:hypothetical protein